MSNSSAVATCEQIMACCVVYYSNIVAVLFVAAVICLTSRILSRDHSDNGQVVYNLHFRESQHPLSRSKMYIKKIMVCPVLLATNFFGGLF